MKKLALLLALLLAACGASPLAGTLVEPIEFSGVFEGRLQAGVVVVEGMATSNDLTVEGEICVSLEALADRMAPLGIDLAAFVELEWCEVFEAEPE